MVYGLSDDVWIALSPYFKEKAVEDFYNNYYDNREDCFVVKGVNDE